MPVRCPILVVHHQAGKEYWAEQEIGDIILPYDPSVKIERTDYRGVLLVYTNLHPAKAYKLVSREILTSVDRVIPITNCLIVRTKNDLENALKEITANAASYECLRPIISLRGRFKEYYHLLENVISQNLRTGKKCSIILYIESIDDLLMYGIQEARGDVVPPRGVEPRTARSSAGRSPS
jgi:hypothetical protein